MEDKLEIERKYLVEMPDIRELMGKYQVKKVKIKQTYLIKDKQGAERRLRKITSVGMDHYFFTRKGIATDNGLIRQEYDIEIDKKYYNKLKKEADNSLNTIRKHRYAFEYNGKTVELDVYKFWRKKAIIEVEINSEKEEIKLPSEIKVIKEVTNDSSYKNINLAKNPGGLLYWGEVWRNVE